MRHPVAYLLSLCLVLLGTGTLQYLHNLQHVAEGCCAEGHRGSQAPVEPAPSPDDDSSCQLCLQLHQHLVAIWASFVVVDALPPIDAVIASAVQVVKPAAIERIDCRGPPARV